MVFVKNFFSTNTISVLSQQLLIHIPFTDSPVLRHPSHGFFVVDSLALVHLHVFFQSHLFPGFCQFFFLLGNALTLDHQHALALWFFHLIAGQCFLERSLIRFLILFRQLPADGQAAVCLLYTSDMKTRITELLGIQYPIIQGGMAWVAEHHLAAAVSAAGGLGLIGGANAPGEVVREEIRKARELTNKPIGVNVMLLSPCLLYTSFISRI